MPRPLAEKDQDRLAFVAALVSLLEHSRSTVTLSVDGITLQRALVAEADTEPDDGRKARTPGGVTDTVNGEPMDEDILFAAVRR